MDYFLGILGFAICCISLSWSEEVCTNTAFASFCDWLIKRQHYAGQHRSLPTTASTSRPSSPLCALLPPPPVHKQETTFLTDTPVPPTPGTGPPAAHEGEESVERHESYGSEESRAWTGRVGRALEGLLIVESTLIDSMCIAEAACSKRHYYQDEHEQNV